MGSAGAGAGGRCRQRWAPSGEACSPGHGWHSADRCGSALPRIARTTAVRGDDRVDPTRRWARAKRWARGARSRGPGVVSSTKEGVGRGDRHDRGL